MKHVLVVRSGTEGLPVVAVVDFDREWMTLRLELHIDPSTSLVYVRSTLNELGTTWKLRSP